MYLSDQIQHLEMTRDITMNLIIYKPLFTLPNTIIDNDKGQYTKYLMEKRMSKSYL